MIGYEVLVWIVAVVCGMAEGEMASGSLSDKD